VALPAVTLLLAQILSSLMHTSLLTWWNYALNSDHTINRASFRFTLIVFYGGNRNTCKTAANTSSTCRTMGKFYLWHAFSLWILLRLWIFASQLGGTSIQLFQLNLLEVQRLFLIYYDNSFGTYELSLPFKSVIVPGTNRRSPPARTSKSTFTSHHTVMLHYQL
jgi:hypothetical protein